MSPHKQKKKYCVRNIFSFSWDTCKTHEKLETNRFMQISFFGGDGVNNLYYGQLVNAGSVPVD